MNIPMSIMAAFLVYRISYMLAREEGTLGIFSFWRGLIDPEQKTWLGRGLNCPLCWSFWIALPAALSLYHGPSDKILFSWFAIAGMAALLERVST